MKKNLLLIFIATLAIFALIFFVVKNQFLKKDSPIACTEEAKICPDGSAVGRSGPLCEFAKCPETPPVSDVSTTKDVILKVKETAKIFDLAITLESIVEDSRCPADVQCFWAGVLEVKVKVADSSESKIMNISSGKGPYVFGDYNISMISVKPMNSSKKQILSSEYEITFRVSKK
jgi:hypothetical protein